jgi:hypothetical protein
MNIAYGLGHKVLFELQMLVTSGSGGIKKDTFSKKLDGDVPVFLPMPMGHTTWGRSRDCACILRHAEHHLG